MSNEDVAIYELAEIDYAAGMKYKDLAAKYGVSINTVKSWKVRYKWSRKSVQKVCESVKKVCKKGAKEENVCTQKEENVCDTHTTEKPKKPDNKGFTNESALNEKQKLFCIYYMRDFNAAHAYSKAYGGAYSTAMSHGPVLLKQEKIKKEINRLKTEFMEEKFNDTKHISEKVVQKYMSIAFSDITDYVTFGKKKVQVGKKKGKPEYINVNYVDLKESTEIDGSLITEIKEGRDGVSIKLASKETALKWLSDHYCFLTQEQQARVDMMKSKTATEEETETEGDGFIEALEGKVDEVWEKE